MPSFQSRLEIMRSTLKYSQVEFSKILGVSQATYSSWELGKTSPREPVLKKLCEFGFDGHWILMGEGDSLRGAQDPPKKEEAPTLSASREEPAPMAIDYSLKEAAEQIREAGLVPALLMGRRGQLDLRWKIVQALVDTANPIQMEELMRRFAINIECSVDAIDLLAELELGLQTGLLKRGPDGYQVAPGAYIKANAQESYYSALRAVIYGLGHNVVPAIKRQDGTGGLGLWEVIVKDGKSFLLELKSRTRELVKEYSADAGEAVSIYIGAAVTPKADNH